MVASKPYQTPGPPVGSRAGAALLLMLALAFAAHAAPAPGSPTILVLGDSLSAAYRMDPAQGWVGLMQRRLDRDVGGWRVINASISGDTTRGGLARLPRALAKHDPDVVVVELGGNDGLRGLSLAQTRRNLAAIVRAASENGARVLLAEMRLPTNYGPAYTAKFQSMYHELAASEGATLVPFLLEGVAGDPALMQADGIHPRAEAQERILENVWPYLESVL